MNDDFYNFKKNIKLFIAEKIRIQESSVYFRVIDMNAWFKIPKKEEYFNIIQEDEFPEVEENYYADVAKMFNISCYILEENEKRYY